MTKAREFRDQTLEELEVSYQEQKKKLFQVTHSLKYQKKNDKPHERKVIRKDIARILTIVTEKKNLLSDA